MLREDKPPSKDKVARVVRYKCFNRKRESKLIKRNWNEEFLNQLVRFPSAKHDDMVDCLVMAITKNMWTNEKIVYFA